MHTDDGNRSPDEEAFLRQFMAEERTLLRFILRYVPAVIDARDVLQETLVTLWAGPPTGVLADLADPIVLLLADHARRAVRATGTIQCVHDLLAGGRLDEHAADD